MNIVWIAIGMLILLLLLHRANRVFRIYPIRRLRRWFGKKMLKGTSIEEQAESDFPELSSFVNSNSKNKKGWDYDV